MIYKKKQNPFNKSVTKLNDFYNKYISSPETGKKIKHSALSKDGKVKSSNTQSQTHELSGNYGWRREKNLKKRLRNIHNRVVKNLSNISLDVSLPDAVKNISNWKENFAENINPQSYDNAAGRLFDAVVNKKKDKWTDNQYGGDILKEREDLMNMMLNRPQVHNTISESQYRPTDSKDKDAVYYSSKQTEKDIKEMLSDTTGEYVNVLENLKQNKYDIGANLEGTVSYGDRLPYGKVLGNYTLDYGKDEDGREYVSYYDKWNVNPTKGLVGDKTIDKIFGMNSPEMYGRIYLDTIPGLKKQEKEEEEPETKEPKYTKKFNPNIILGRKNIIKKGSS